MSLMWAGEDCRSAEGYLSLTDAPVLASSLFIRSTQTVPDSSPNKVQFLLQLSPKHKQFPEMFFFLSTVGLIWWGQRQQTPAQTLNLKYV